MPLRINDAGHHLLNLVSDILDLAKIEAGRFTPDFRDVDLAEIIQQCASAGGAPGPGKADRARREPAVRRGCGWRRMRGACKQIVINLLSNAVKFARDQGEVAVRC